MGVRWEAELSEGMGWEDGNTDYPHNEADKDSIGMKPVRAYLYTQTLQKKNIFSQEPHLHHN